jgi:hypothetical protein
MSMAKKATAGILLFVIVAWAEMSMAPMIAMHAGHMRAGHEMVSDMPPGHPAHHHSQAAQSEWRPCCPGVHRTDQNDVLEVVSGAPACDDPHSCCFRQGPQNIPAPARDVLQFSPELALGVVNISPFPIAAEHPIRERSPELSTPPDIFGMILRV